LAKVFIVITLKTKIVCNIKNTTKPYGGIDQKPAAAVCSLGYLALKKAVGNVEDFTQVTEYAPHAPLYRVGSDKPVAFSNGFEDKSVSLLIKNKNSPIDPFQRIAI